MEAGIRLYAGVMTALAVGAVAACAWALTDRAHAVAELGAAKTDFAARTATLASERDALKQAVDAAYKPKEVGGTVDFPIMRTMARPGDSVETFAARERTPPEVVRALNPILKRSERLVAGQELWIPKNTLGRGEDGAVTPAPLR